MVVNQHNERRLHGNRHAEHLTRMHQQGVHRADGHQMMSLYPPSRVQEQHHETFAIRVEILMSRNMQPPIIGDLLRLFTDLHFLRHWTVPQGDNLEFLRIVVFHTATSGDSMKLLPRMKSVAFCACAAACTMSILSLRNRSSQLLIYAAELSIVRSAISAWPQINAAPISANNSSLQ